MNKTINWRNKAKLDYHLNQCKLKTGGVNVEERWARILADPACTAKLYNVFDYSHAILTNGSLADVPNAKVYVVQFDCALGVWLPYHLLQLSQALLEKGLHLATDIKPTNESGFMSGEDKGAFKEVSWATVNYVYYSEFDQIVRFSGAHALNEVISMLNSTWYVAPQRMNLVASYMKHWKKPESHSITEIEFPLLESIAALEKNPRVSSRGKGVFHIEGISLSNWCDTNSGGRNASNNDPDRQWRNVTNLGRAKIYRSSVVG
jgi:hypothetical protein